MKLFKFRRVCDEYMTQIVIVAASDVRTARKMANRANKTDGLPTVCRDVEIVDAPGMHTVWVSHE